MRLTLVLLNILFAGHISAQTGTYTRDLAALKDAIVKTPGFKAQIKGKKKADYNKLYQSLMADSLHAPGDAAYFDNLARLFFPIRDNHLAFYQLSDTSNFKDQQAIEAYLASAEFSGYPHVTLDIDSLSRVLAARPLDSIEGIYHYGEYYSVGLFRTGPQTLQGVVIQSIIPIWVKGQIAIRLYEQEPGSYKAIYGHPVSKHFMLTMHERSMNRSLLNAHFYGSYFKGVYAKQLSATDHVNLPASTPLFQYRMLSPTMQYMAVRSFQNNGPVQAESRKFLQTLKDSLKAPNLILDLRNNNGGSASAAKPYLELISDYVRRGKVYVLTNNETLSQAELLILKLKRMPNVVTVGQTTKGMLTYGSNYGRRVKLPSGKFEMYPTDMKGSAERLKYEDRGIEPDIMLAPESDWIMQIMKLIS
jgi:hypothetical protein